MTLRFRSIGFNEAADQDRRKFAEGHCAGPGLTWLQSGRRSGSAEIGGDGDCGGGGSVKEDIIRAYRELQTQDIRQALQYASALANEEIGFYGRVAHDTQSLKESNHAAVHLRDEV